MKIAQIEIKRLKHQFFQQGTETLKNTSSRWAGSPEPPQAVLQNVGLRPPTPIRSQAKSPVISSITLNVKSNYSWLLIISPAII